MMKTYICIFSFLVIAFVAKAQTEPQNTPSLEMMSVITTPANKTVETDAGQPKLENAAVAPAKNVIAPNATTAAKETETPKLSEAAPADKPKE